MVKLLLYFTQVILFSDRYSSIHFIWSNLGFLYFFLAFWYNLLCYASIFSFNCTFGFESAECEPGPSPLVRVPVWTVGVCIVAVPSFLVSSSTAERATNALEAWDMPNTLLLGLGATSSCSDASSESAEKVSISVLLCVWEWLLF